MCRGGASSLCPSSVQDVLRKDQPDVVFSTEQAKWNTVLTEIQYMHESGRPVLVGTTSVERSEYLAKLLTETGIKFQVGTSSTKLVASAGSRCNCARMHTQNRIDKQS